MCPPGVDQTTRSSQKWFLLSPELCQRQGLIEGAAPYGHDNPANFMSQGSTWDAFQKLAKPSIDRNAFIDWNQDLMASSAGVSPVERMPAELLAMLLAQSSLTARDVLAFGVCSKTLWQHVILHIHQDKRQSASWADKPLLCTGTWLKDLPQSMYDKDPELNEYEQHYRNHQGHWWGACPARGWNWRAVSQYEHVTEKSCKQKWIGAFDDAAWMRSVSAPYGDLLRASLVRAFEPQDLLQQHHWILRNQTLKKFVRLKVSRVRRSQKATIHVRGAPWLSVDQALILRICWGQDLWSSGLGADREQSKSAKLVRGTWAAHRFDIVEDSVLLDGEWQDDTSEIVSDGKAWRTS